MLHTEEFEIIVPDAVTTGDRTPLILRIGPMTGMLIPVIVMALFGSRIYSGSTHGFMYFGMVTALSSALSGMLWAAISAGYRNREQRSLIENSGREFERYMTDTRSFLQKCMKENREYMYQRYRSSSEIVSSGCIMMRYPGAGDHDFLRLGTGRVPFQMKIRISNNRRELFESPESAKARALADEFKTLDDVPAGIDMTGGTITGIVRDRDDTRCMELFLDILIKISDQYSPTDLKTCLFFDENSSWQRLLYETVKFMPHMFAQGGLMRLCAGNARDAAEIIPYLGERVESGRERYVVFVIEPGLIKGELIEERILSPGDDDRLTTLYLSDSADHLPAECRSTIILPPGGIRSLNVACDRSMDATQSIIGDHPPSVRESSGHMRRFFADTIRQDPFFDEIPQSVDFLQLFGAKSVDDIPIKRMWKNDHPEDRLRTPIGLGSRAEKVYLDVHERFCGPHGLIAGTTGSGKSELIQTYLISLCLTFSPSEVNFFIIDYKGGGTGNALRDLPHCAGVISNLSGSQIKRALSAIRSENARRQRLLAEHGVSHIDDYNRQRRTSEGIKPLPHLLLIIDEFAELRKEEPDFMAEIISLSAVGRSLGIHLILATQKPSGVVDDKIWSNSRFRLCLKVQDKQDSMDMLKRPEAAYLKRAGQCYMQIGLDEYFKCFQTGYIKEIYDEGRNDKKVFLVKRSGQRIDMPGKAGGDKRTLLDVLEELIVRTAREEGYAKCPTLWTDELPDVIPCDTNVINEILGTKDHKTTGDCRVMLGIYDDPSNQQKGMFVYDPYLFGHMALAGCPGSGRTSMLRNIAYGLHNYELILIDLSNGPLSGLKKLPNCRGSLFSAEGIRIFFYHLNKILTRQDRPLFILIDNFGLFIKSLNDEQTALIVRLLSEGIGNNIYLIVTCGTVSDIPSGMFSKIKTGLCLEMTDKFGIADMLRHYRIDVIPKKGVPGRGVIKTDEGLREFQAIKPAWDGLPDDTGNCLISAERFPDTEADHTLSGMLADIKDNPTDIIPIGYSRVTGMIRGIDINAPSTFAIMGSNRYECLMLLENIKKSIRTLYPGLIDKCVFASDPAGNDLPKTLPGDGFVFAILGNRATAAAGAKDSVMKIVSEGQGIYIGSDALSQNVLDLTDVPFRELNGQDEGVTALMRLRGKKRTIRLLIPTDRKESDKDDYD